MSVSRFHWLDYVVACGMMMVSLGIGFFFSCYKGGQKTKTDYMLGGRQMSLAPVCLSLFVTFQSAISLIGTPSDTFNTGPMFFWFSLGISLAYLMGVVTVVPLMYPLRVTSVYEYLGLRFQSQAVRLLGTCIGMLQTILYMAVALFSPALALQAAGGIPLWVSIAIVGGIGTLYTAVGGIKSVVWTDAFQTIIVFIGIATVFIKGLMAVGGFSRMFEIATEGNRIDFFEFNADPRERHGLLACVIGGCFMWITNCFNQSSVQRIGSLKTLKAARWSFLLNIPLNIVYGMTLTMTGILLYAYVITIGCDPYKAGLVNNKNQMMPYFVIHVLDEMPGMAGLYMSMLFGGALSTVSSGISALSANTVEDLLARPLRGVKDGTATVIAKCLVGVYGVMAIGLAYLMKSMSGPVTQLATTAFGACGGPVVGIFMLGGAFPRGNKYGAFFGGLIALAVSLWIAVGSRLYGAPTPSLPPGPTHNCSNHVNASLIYGSMTSERVEYNYVTTSSSLDLDSTSTYPVDRSFSVYDLSYLWLGFIGVVVSMVSGIIISCLTGCQDPDTLDPRLIIPIFRKLYGMPEPVHRPEDSSNVIAMKHYRQAWDVYRDRSLDQETGDVMADVTGNENGSSFKPLRPGDSSERMSFLKKNGTDAD